MKKLWKKTIVIWSKNRDAVDLAAREAIKVARTATTTPTVSYGFLAKQVQPETDPDFDPMLVEEQLGGN